MAAKGASMDFYDVAFVVLAGFGAVSLLAIVLEALAGVGASLWRLVKGEETALERTRRDVRS
jgi:hypothetical protein